MKRYLAILAAAVILLGIMWAHDALADDDYTTMYVQEQSIKAYRDRDDSSIVETTLQPSEAFRVYEIRGNWARTDVGESQCSWVAIRYHDTLYISTTEPESDYPKYQVVGGRVRLRGTIGGDFKRWVDNGTIVEGKIVFDGWVFTGDGWIDAAYLEKSAHE